MSDEVQRLFEKKERRCEEHEEKKCVVKKGGVSCSVEVWCSVCGVLNRLNSMAWDEQAAKHTLWLLDKQEAASGTSPV